MTGKIFSFCQDSDNVNNNHCRSRGKDNMLLDDFNDHHIKKMFCISNFLDLLLILIFVKNNIFSGKDLASGSHCTYNFFNSTLSTH